MSKGYFITFEGIDGSGKTTQLKKIKEYLENKGYDVIVTREPGALDIGKNIRSILLQSKNNISNRCEMFLFLADRANHIQLLVEPSINQGKIVLCDRHTDSTIAYQGYGRGENIEELKKLNNIAVGNIIPDLTILFDISVETADKRLNSNKDRMESLGYDFYNKVREGYLKLQKDNPNRIKIVDANKNIENVFQNTKNIIDKLLQEK